MFFYSHPPAHFFVTFGACLSLFLFLATSVTFSQTIDSALGSLPGEQHYSNVGYKKLEGRVTKIGDGSTVVIRKLLIRLQGIYVPSCADPVYGAGASRLMRDLVLNEELSCWLNNEESYDRRIGVCFLDGEDIATKIIASGFGLDCPRYSEGRYRSLEVSSAIENIELPPYCGSRLLAESATSVPTEQDYSDEGHENLRGLVTHVRDGDTIEISDTAIRLNGLHAAECRDPDTGSRATERMRDLVSDKDLSCWLTGEERGRGRQKYYFGICFLGDEDIGGRMVAEGLALDCPNFSNGRYRDLESLAGETSIRLPGYCR